MLNRLLVTAFVAVLAASLGHADQAKAKVTITVNRTAPNSGKQMYVNYCAPCHGIDGRGQGPVAPALKIPPTDLTILSRAHHGKFPDTHIVTVLQNGSETPTHGTREMPVWGPILGKMDQTNRQDRLLRISNLSRYLETIQSK
jgi:mono/diheme cytochrome c family protein